MIDGNLFRFNSNSINFRSSQFFSPPNHIEENFQFINQIYLSLLLDLLVDANASNNNNKNSSWK